MALKLRVCASSDLPDGEMREFDVPGIEHPILLLRRAHRVYAANGICPHEVVHLAKGSHKGAVVTCPGHGYSFDLETGKCKHDPSLVLPTYEVSIEDGWIHVELISARSESS